MNIRHLQAPVLVALAYRLTQVRLNPFGERGAGAPERLQLHRVAASLISKPPRVVDAGRHAMDGIRAAARRGAGERPETALLGACAFLLSGAQPAAPDGQAGQGLSRASMTALAGHLAAVHLLLPSAAPNPEAECLERVHGLLFGAVKSVDLAEAEAQRCLDAANLDQLSTYRPATWLLLACWRLLVAAKGDEQGESSSAKSGYSGMLS